MLEIHVEARELLLHPIDVLVDVCGVDNEEKLLGTHLIDQQVIDCAAVGVAHHTVEHLSIGCSGDVIGENVLNVALSVGTGDEHLAHVRNVEHAAGLAHGIVLVGDVCVLNGHVEAGKRRHQCAQFHVFVIKTGLFFHKFLIIKLLC